MRNRLFFTALAAVCTAVLFSCEKAGGDDDSKTPSDVLAGEDGARKIDFGYWTEESAVYVTTDKMWKLTIPEDAWFEIREDSAMEWEKRQVVSGTGNAVLQIRSAANDKFEARSSLLYIEMAGQKDSLELTQAASPDMLMLLEDEIFRMAASTSVIIYGMDVNEDSKISASEAEFVPEDNVPYGIDAGGWNVTSVKGIENFPHIRHIDLNTSPELKEVDLSRNPDIMSVHVHNCPKLETIDISKCTELMEFGCDYRVFLKVEGDILRLKDRIHTLGIFNRQESEPSDLDFSGFSALSRLHINDNHLTSLNLDGCSSLWKLIAYGNDFTELDLSGVDRHPDNSYMINNCPQLKTVYVWEGWTEDYYYIFEYDRDNGVNFVEK